MVRHLLPNTTGVLLVASLTQLNRAILTEATISFLGHGRQATGATWGNLLIGAQNYLWTAPWLAIVPGVAITRDPAGDLHPRRPPPLRKHPLGDGGTAHSCSSGLWGLGRRHC